jgi:hypothetical protein
VHHEENPAQQKIYQLALFGIWKQDIVRCFADWADLCRRIDTNYGKVTETKQLFPSDNASPKRLLRVEDFMKKMANQIRVNELLQQPNKNFLIAEELDILHWEICEWDCLLNHMICPGFGGDYHHNIVYHVIAMIRKFKNFNGYSNEGMENSNAQQRRTARQKGNQTE